MHRDLIAHKVYRRPIVTELMPFKAFYPADMYHQDYYRNHRGNDYSTIYIEPKLRKLRQTLQPPKSSKAKTSAKANAPTETTSAAVRPRPRKSLEVFRLLPRPCGTRR